MSATFNIYCDESCHIGHDHIPVMVLALYGALKYQQKISPE